MGVGLVTAKQALEWGFSGPMLRGSGVYWDLRKTQPYSIYPDLEFSVPVGKNGDCYDRYQIRVQEMRESIKIASQCVRLICKGPVQVSDRKINPPQRASMK